MKSCRRRRDFLLLQRQQQRKYRNDHCDNCSDTGYPCRARRVNGRLRHARLILKGKSPSRTICLLQLMFLDHHPSLRFSVLSGIRPERISKKGSLYLGQPHPLKLFAVTIHE